MRHSINFRWCCILACMLVPTQAILANAPADNPVQDTYRKTAAWTNRLPWQKVTLANDIAGLIGLNNYVDSAIMMNAMNTISSKGGGILQFASGTYYFTYDLALPANIIIRGEAPSVTGAAAKGTDWLTRLVFPRLYLARMNPPKALEPYATAPKKIYYAGAADGFTGLVNLDINRATISLGGTSADKAVAQVLVYGVRSNNASQLDVQVPTQVQVSNRAGWQIWPDRAVPNISIGFAANCLVAQTLVNDEPTDNVSQPDFMTDDGMRFDGSRAEYRVTDHPGIHVWSADNTGRKTSMQVTDNIVYASQGYEAIVSSNAAALAGNQSRTITYKGNHVKDGKSASDAAYNLLYNDEIKSSKGVFVSEWNDSLPYTLIEPENYDPSKKYPLVVFLHDFWEKGSDNKRHLRQFVWQFLTPENRSKYPCFIVAPQLPMAEPKWKTDGLGSETWPIQCNSLLITELGTKFSIDDKRVYAVGNSMGGAGALNLAIQHPDQIAAVVGISVFYRLTKNSSLQVSKIPIWLIWGEKDERIEPLVKQSIRTDLRGANANFKFTEIAGMGHRCWNDIVAEVPGFMPWLFAQRK